MSAGQAEARYPALRIHSFEVSIEGRIRSVEVNVMRTRIFLFAAVALTATAANADSQSSNTSSNSSSNNGVVRQRVVDTYCENGWCERTVERRTYRDDRKRYRNDRRYRWVQDNYGNWYGVRRDDD